jgi:erythromycin esterase-like protein
MWRNAEVSEFMEWMRTYNEARPSADRVEFRGLDIYGLRGSIAAVLDYLDRVDPAEAAAARHRYGCLTPWQHEPQEYGRAMLHHERPACEDAVVQQVKALLDRRLGVIAQDGEAWFDATQNARAVRAAEHYYRAMFLGAAESWNLRDRHMFDTLRSLLQARGPEAKAVVWAHNSHIGNAAATEMGWQGEFNIGELCRTAYADDAVLIGFGTDRGTVAAASNWNAPMAIREVRPSLPDSYERAFRDVGQPRSLTDWRRPDRARLRACLSSPRLERAIGVIYRADRERQSHYFQAVLSEQFDAFVWFEDTTAVTPLGEEHAKQLPDTFPFAL